QRRSVLPLRSSRTTRHLGSGSSPALEPNSKSTAKISRKGRSNTALDPLDDRVILVADAPVLERALHAFRHTQVGPNRVRNLGRVDGFADHVATRRHVGGDASPCRVMPRTSAFRTGSCSP